MKNQVQDAEEKRKNPSTVALKSKDLKPRKKATKMTKDIYAVKYVTSDKVIAKGFEKKQDAKAKRNELCKGAHDKWAKKVKENKDEKKQINKPFPYIVVKGKEHPLYRA